MVGLEIRIVEIMSNKISKTPTHVKNTKNLFLKLPIVFLKLVWAKTISKIISALISKYILYLKIISSAFLILNIKVNHVLLFPTPINPS